MSGMHLLENYMDVCSKTAMRDLQDQIAILQSNLLESRRIRQGLERTISFLEMQTLSAKRATIVAEQRLSVAVDAGRFLKEYLLIQGDEIEEKTRENAHLRQQVEEKTIQTKEDFINYMNTLLQTDKCSRALTKLVWEKAHGKKEQGSCFVCDHGIEFSKAWHCSQVVAKAKGGLHVLENLVTCCEKCHEGRGDEDLFAISTSRGI